MKKAILLLFCIALFIGTSTNKVKAQARSMASISAAVVTITTATERSQLNFGLCSPGSQGGQVLLSPQGDIATMGTVVVLNNAPSPASFYITGIRENAFSITLSSGPTILNHNGSTSTMLVHGWESVPSADTGALKLEGGALAVNVGAILDMSNSKENPVGVYAGTYSITFDYN